MRNKLFPKDKQIWNIIKKPESKRTTREKTLMSILNDKYR